MEQDKEEGEMSDDTEMLVDEEEANETDARCTVLYTADKSGPLVKTLNKIDATKLEERAKRFGLDLSGNRMVSQTQIDELYCNAGIESGNERHFRFDTLHLNGVHGLATKEIFDYLEDYKPVSLEWIDNNSCNIVCQDHISVALALLVHSREIKNDEVNKLLLQKSSYHWREGMPHPKRDLILMRFATNSDKKIPIKLPEQKAEDEENINNGKNPWGDLCKSWGVYDHQEVFQRKLPKTDFEDVNPEEEYPSVKIKNKRLAMRLGKRNHKDDEDESSSSDSEWKTKSKTPRMRMHADDEESKQRKQNVTKQINIHEEEIYAPLSIEVVNTRSSFAPRETRVSDKIRFQNVRQENNKRTYNVHRTIQSRLGAKVAPEELSNSSDECSSNDSDPNIMSRVQKMSSASKNYSDVWSRLDNIAQNVSHKDLRQILTTRKADDHKHKAVDKHGSDDHRHGTDDYRHGPDDLRGRLGKSKQCNLRIEIDNNYVDE